jgi:YYY domain-containing protein
VTGGFLFVIAVLALGPIGAQFAALLFPRLPEGGRVFGRPLGLLLAAYPLWLLASLGVVRYGRSAVVVSAASLAAGGATLAYASRRRAPQAAPSRSIRLVGEAVFAVAFAGWLGLRSFAPAVWQTEKPMDMAIVNAVNRAASFPPHDPWLAGAHTNYYYFGHYLVAFLVRLTGVDPATGFNFAVALVAALAASAVFGVAATLHSAARQAGATRRGSPIAVGLTATALATVLGNLAGVSQLVHHAGRLSTYDWFAPSRVIPHTANEFPFFSFLLADLHAHVMASPFALVAIAYAMQLAVHGPPRRVTGRAVAELVIAAVVLGALYALNGLDFPTAAAITVAGLVLWSFESSGRGGAAARWCAALLAAAVVAFLPFWLQFSPPTHGLALLRDHLRFGRFAIDYLLLYGISLWMALVVFAGRFRLTFRYASWLGSVAFFVLVLLAPPRLAGLGLAVTLAALAAYATLSSGSTGGTYRFLWLLLTSALTLVAAGELVYVRDAFENTPSFRFNTVFKTGYQAWYLFAIVAAVGVYWSADWLKRRIRLAWLACFSVLVALGLVYPVLATYSRSDGFRPSPTLDGERWLERAAPGDAAAIAWLRRSVKGDPTVLETVGADFDPDGRGRVSTFTGLPAVIEWPGHEVQWGHEPGRRAVDVRRIYATLSARVAKRLLDRYDVSFVFVGSLERRDFPPFALAKFGSLGTVAFRSGRTLVYRVER